jgi:hypothetical protein
MLAKKTSKNQVTLPEAVVRHFADTEFFDITEENGRIILTPVSPGGAESVRNKLAERGIAEDDVQDAVEWARKKK